jgi:hypothetical protein
MTFIVMAGLAPATRDFRCQTDLKRWMRGTRLGHDMVTYHGKQAP